jgi:hypothetical protein
MNLLIQAANLYTPAALKRKKLEELFACTAAAFGCEMPRVRGLPYGELLQSYARFTAEQASQALRSAIPDVLTQAVPRESATPDLLPKPTAAQAKSQKPLFATLAPHASAGATRDEPELELAEIQRRLYDGAYRMGQELRRTFRIANTGDALAAARVLYRALGIDLRATPAGKVTVHRCFFSDYYSSPVCQVIASLDEGIFAGLSGGGQLAFTRRITEGHECCKAEFRPSTATEVAV